MDYTKFRSSVVGFRRSDVFAYIEQTSQEHRSAIRELEKRNEALAAENRSLQQQLEQLQNAAAPAAPSAPAEPAEVPAAQLSLDAQELAAYRRAEALERAARRRVDRLRGELSALIERTQTSLEETGAEADILAQTLQQQLSAIQALGDRTQALITELSSQVAALAETEEQPEA